MPPEFPQLSHLFDLPPWAVIALLYVLAVLDCAFASYRCAGGKNALIDKRRYYASALIKGAIWGNVAVAIGGACIVLSAAILSGSIVSVFPLYVEAGRCLLDVYLPYTFIVLTALAARAIPSADVRSVAQTIVLGPFTFIRPAVATIGVAYAVVNLQSPLLLLAGIPILCIMLGFEFFLERQNL